MKGGTSRREANGRLRHPRWLGGPEQCQTVAPVDPVPQALPVADCAPSQLKSCGPSGGTPSTSRNAAGRPEGVRPRPEARRPAPGQTQLHQRSSSGRASAPSRAHDRALTSKWCSSSRTMVAHASPGHNELKCPGAHSTSLAGTRARGMPAFEPDTAYTYLGCAGTACRVGAISAKWGHPRERVTHGSASGDRFALRSFPRRCRDWTPSGPTCACTPRHTRAVSGE